MEHRTRISRRSIVVGAAALGTAGAVPAQQAAAQAQTNTAARGTTRVPGTGRPTMRSIDFTDGSAALTPDRTVATACQFCNANCRLHVDLKADRVIGIRGEEQDAVQDGSICVKAEMMPELVYNEARLTSPLRRVSGPKGSRESRFEEISWTEALETIARRLLHLRDTGQAHTIANRATGRMPQGTTAVIARLFALLGSPNNIDVGPVCNDAGGNALATTFGMGNFTNGYGVDAATGKQDLGAARHLLFLGTNQAETHPVTFEFLLRRREETGATLTVVDPRLTPTGTKADRWVSPKPHTDYALVLAMLDHIIRNGLYDRQFVKDWVAGFTELERHLAQHGYTPAWASEVTGVPETTIIEMAEEYASARPAAIFCNAGISHQLGAFDTYRTLAFLAAVTGNIGVPGGGCNFMHNTWPGALELPALDGALPKVREALPVGPDYFAESILTGEPYRLKAVITQGNPLVSSSNTTKVREAFEQLDFYVYTGLFMEEPAYYADIILPVCSGLEMDGVYMRRDDRAIRWQDQAVPRVGESKPDWEIWVQLARTMARLDTRRPAGQWTKAFPARWDSYANLWADFVEHTPGMGGMSRARLRKRSEPLRWPCPTDQHPGVSTLFADHPSWYEAAASLSPAHRGKRFLTPSGKVEITTPELESGLKASGHGALPVFYTHPEVTGAHPTVRFEEGFVPNPLTPRAVTHPVVLGVQGSDAVHRNFPLMGMTGRPSVVHFAEVTHWTRTGKQLNGVRFIQIHPRTARLNGIADGDEVKVESPRGSVTGHALVWEGIRQDTVFVPNTFGPAQSVGDVFGASRYEPANVLLDDRFYDNLSGQQAYKCFACRVTKV
ncbi:molybdopterin-dependent oxidoreductase [Streptomyces sp. NBC_01808]|nr:molybdopterin-dependent oxidoreductase [Streptomyces sp. NBC_01808]WSA41527.1 molybdopterin-dependent oxidoreductase [Streptomyces sp. NBC_01808]